jgi:hypothetical protein
MSTVNRDLILSSPFLEAILKNSEDCEDLLELCGRIKLQRAAVAIVETYLEMDAPLLDWLNEQIVDVIYLDDGRIIDVKGNDVRAAIAAAKVHPVDTRGIGG